MSKMKDSGVEWIGEIPNTWSILKLLYVLRAPISDGPHETPNLVDNGIPFISVDSLNDSEDIDFDVVKKYISEDDYKTYCKKAKLEEGDILFSKAATIGKTAIVKKDKFMVWSPLAIIKTNNALCHNKYLYYVLNCDDLIKYISLLGGYNTQINVGMRDLEQAQIPLPSIDEQKTISSLLDIGKDKIASLIINLNNQIDKLKEYKKALITKCVTKGLDPNVPLKDSGIDWIGEMPKNWTLTKLKRHSDIIMGQSPASEDIKEEGTTLFMQGNKDFGQKNPFPSLYCETCNKFSRVGDILLSVRAPVGAINESDKAYGIGRGLCSIKAIQIDRHYLKYYLIKSADDFKYYSNGTTFDEITVDILRNLYLVLPSASEQKYIANYLDKKCSEIDALITSKQSQIDKLNEYQESLIYEYVTGKKEVS